MIVANVIVKVLLTSKTVIYSIWIAVLLRVLVLIKLGGFKIRLFSIYPVETGILKIAHGSHIRLTLDS